MTLKIPQPLIDTIREKIAPLDTDKRRARYLSVDFHNSSKVHNLAMRYRFDLLSTAVTGAWVCDNLYKVPGVNDDHIDSMLRHLLKMGKTAMLSPHGIAQVAIDEPTPPLTLPAPAAPVIHIKHTCATCGSDDVRANADLEWSTENQEWEVCSIFDDASCEDCGGETSINEVPMP